jgi:DNA helicase-2/ATP-dependent DNA helicase PcrA
VLSDPLQYNLDINKGTAKRLEDFRTLMNRFMTNSQTQNVYESVKEIVQKTGLFNELYNDKTPEGLSRVQNVEELVDSLYEFVSSRLEEGRQDVKMGDFLLEVSLLTDQDNDKSENNDRITMMTVHAAKGLEFKNVFVVGLEEDLFPSEMSKSSQKGLEEERRLLYVAITRAEENAILTYAKNRFRNGQSRICSPSRFLKDIDPACLHSSDLHIRDMSRKWPLAEEIKPLSKHQDIDGLAVGNLIKHERFGAGKIIELTGENENARASVEFESFGKKQLLLKFAKFEIIKK